MAHRVQRVLLTSRVHAAERAHRLLLFRFAEELDEAERRNVQSLMRAAARQLCVQNRTTGTGVLVMKDDWNADVEVEPVKDGLFSPVLVLSPAPKVGPPVRIKLEGAYENAELAKLAAMDAFAAMTREMPRH